MYRLIRYAQPLATSAHRSPWTGLDQEINSLFTSALADFVPGATRSIPVSLHEDKDNLQVIAELPGVARDDVNVELTDDVLSLSATRKQGEQTFTFEHSFTLPYAVQAEKIAAELKDGVLRLTLPKAEAVKPRKITIS
ncbi:MAG TPA: Hsp20/alpha crystallin family protein [Lacunisphaera sp.]|nr:Hsp20/alpha crystallin family protein [Lacunisphaera sp.]